MEFPRGLRRRKGELGTRIQDFQAMGLQGETTGRGRLRNRRKEQSCKLWYSAAHHVKSEVCRDEPQHTASGSGIECLKTTMPTLACGHKKDLKANGIVCPVNREKRSLLDKRRLLASVWPLRSRTQQLWTAAHTGCGLTNIPPSLRRGCKLVTAGEGRGTFLSGDSTGNFSVVL